MKANVTMKALSAAVLGLAGMAFAGSSMAQSCPAGPTAWTSQTATAGTLAIVSPGDNGTQCRLSANFNNTASVIAKAFVQWTGTGDEARYRSRYYIDTAQLGGLTTPLRSVQIFIASSATPSAGTTAMVRAFLIGVGGVPTVRFIIADASQAGNARTIDAVLPNATGKNRIEIDLQTGAAGSFRYWVSDAATATTDGAPTGNVTGVNNAGWVGVRQIVMGLSNGSAQFRANYGTANPVFFDEFDSRRQTFIGQ